MARVRWSNNARGDLDALKTVDPAAAAYLAQLMAEAQRCPELFETLSTHNFGGDAADGIGVKKWHAQQHLGRNLWRCRMWGYKSYRVVYALHPEERCYYILAVVERSRMDYDDHDSPLTQRICADYDRIGIPDYSGRR